MSASNCPSSQQQGVGGQYGGGIKDSTGNGVTGGGSVDEAEKHLLGNLLDDDPFSPPRSSPNRNISSSSGAETAGPPTSRGNSGASNVIGSPASAIPPASVINGVALGPLGDVGMTTYWPEPPPPYTASIQSPSWSSSSLKPSSSGTFSTSGANPLSDFLQAQLFKETPSNLNELLSSEPALLRQFTSAATRDQPLSKFPSSASVAQAQGPHSHAVAPQIQHHIHHNFHTHTHNIVENHHHYPLPLSHLSQGFAPSGGNAPMPVPLSSVHVPVPVSDASLFSSQTLNAARAAATTANRFPPPPPPGAQTQQPLPIGHPQQTGHGQTKGKGGKSYVNVASAGHHAHFSHGQQQRHSSASSLQQALPQSRHSSASTTNQQQMQQQQQNPIAACIYNIHYDDPPHSAPVVNKMPFSYRDVAARSDAHTANSGNGSPLQMSKRNRDDGSGGGQQVEQISPLGGSGTASEGESTRAGTKRSSDALSTDNETIHLHHIINNATNSKLLQKDRKVKSENGFQKITNKKAGKSHNKEKMPLAETNSLPVASEESVTVEAPTRYEVLQKLAASPKNLASNKMLSDNTAKEDPDAIEGLKKRVPARATIVRSRSNSVAHGEEQEEEENSSVIQTGGKSTAGTATGTLGNAVAKRMFPPVEKKKPAAAAKKSGRSGRKRSETPLWDVVAHYITLFAGMVGTMLCGFFNMLFDIAVALWGIVIHYCKMAYTYVLLKLRQCCVTTISGIRNTMHAVVSFRPSHLLDIFLDQSGPFGLEQNIQPTNVEEIMDLLVSRGRRSRDAYAALGLRADCSDEEVRKNYGKIYGLLQHSSHEAVEEALAVIVSAFGILHSATNRHVYKANVLSVISAQKELTALWETAIERIAEARTTMLCDCGSRHSRRPLPDVRPAEARYCKRCGIHHSAKANDIWVETRLCGLSWVYFTCADGIVYEITEWATCEANYLKHMRPNAHHVQYRLVSPSSLLSDRDLGVGTSSNSGNNAGGKLTDEYGEQAGARASGSALTQQVSYRPAVEPRDEDRNRRAANRRQKRR